MTNRVSSFPGASAPAPLHRCGGSIGSTSELSISAIGDTYFIEGSGTVTSLPSWARGSAIFLHILAAPTFVNSAKLLMPAGQNYTFAAGDSAVMLPLGNGVWRCTEIFRADGKSTLNAWANIRVAKTAAYTVLNSDKASTIALGGTAFYALTFSAASGYDSNFTVMVVNEDTGRAKWIIVPGYAQGGLYLWPGQNVIIFNQNNVWYVHGKTRYKVPGTTFNMFTNYSQTGNDTVGATDGLTSGTGAFRSVQRALDIAADEFDFSALATAQTLVVINMAASVTDAQGVHFANRSFVGAQGGAAVKIAGGGASVMSPTGTDAFGFFCNVIVQISTVKIQTTTSGAGVVADLGAQVYLLDQLDFGACPGGAHEHLQLRAYLSEQ
jgi:hypothetical protein